mmetsp:Transcript_15695/g.28636  ORF Transcript_15695/g.28636 Transcript_15695/m.28636 type:complete len:274 (+) Transcript_15695:132-953(+)
MQGDVFRKVIASFVARIGAILVGLPFDVVKTRLQTTNSQRGAFATVINMVTTEGPTSLWKGILPCFVTSIPITLSFTYYALFKRDIASEFTSNIHGQAFIAGSMTGATNAVITAPFDRVRVMIQANKGKSQVSFSNIYAAAGFRGFYKGFTAYFLREVIGCGFYFGVYDYALSKQDEIGSAKLMLAGALAGVSFWSAIFPIDCIKTRMQADCLTSPKYRSFIDCLRQTVHSEGAASLYRGYFPVILRTIPANAVFILLYGSLLKLNTQIFSQP